MGSCSSKIDPSESSVTSPITKRQWKSLPGEEEAILSYQCEGTINGGSSKEHVEFRALLDYPIFIQHVNAYIRSEAVELERSFLCWQELRRYKELPVGFDRLPPAQSLFDAYIRDNNFVGKTTQDMTEQRIKQGISHPEMLLHALDIVYAELFGVLFENVFMQFRDRPEFQELRLQICETYNTVLSKDFDYLRVLGKGGFGLVCEVRKKTTGVRYAMKIQSKEGVVKSFGSEPWRACLEMRAFASCKHPFIVELYCAYQTESLLIMVMSLGTWCDLSKLLKVGGPLPYNHTLFYSAEVTSALSYLHSKHFLFRDLKPANVLLNADGHVQLVDFGAVCDLRGDLLEQCQSYRNIASYEIPLFAESPDMINMRSLGGSYGGGLSASYAGAEKYATLCAESPEPVRKRANSIVGTCAYMAPEMVVLLGEENRVNSGYDVEKLNRGYTKAVDWWSLGVLVYKMLVGQYPFPDGVNRHSLPTWDILSAPVDYSSSEALRDHPEAVNFISALLTVDDTRRLGSESGGGCDGGDGGGSGGAAVRKHPFFSTINWALLEAKQMVPPDLPKVNIPHGQAAVEKASRGPSAPWTRSGGSGKVQYTSLSAMLEAHKRNDWLIFGTQESEKAIQPQFAAWNYTSPMLINTELSVINVKRDNSESTSLNNSLSLGRWSNSISQLGGFIPRVNNNNSSKQSQLAASGSIATATSTGLSTAGSGSTPGISPAVFTPPCSTCIACDV